MTPIYRLYNTKTGVHLYTRGEADRDKVLRTWPEFEFTDGAPAFWAHIALDAGPKLYRYQGPNITIGLYEYTRDELSGNSFRITSDKPYLIKNKDGKIIAKVQANAQTRVKYLNDDDHTYRIYNSISEITATNKITFESQKEYDVNMVFDIDRPDMNFSKYRGKLRLQYSNSNGIKHIWVINELPLEQYIWGMGEITGTGPMEYNKMMTTAYRTYGYWKILYSTKYAIEGFKVNATPGNQLYYGFEWEKRYPRIKQGAEATRGKIAKHKDDVALTPYSSWTDGRTRSFEEHWGSTLYPWCQSVKDPYGDYNGDYYDNPHKSTQELFNSGNHMVGISAHGALTLANDKGWDWDKIIKYYLNNISIVQIY
jgi:peptidoglycan hydrolase-like amidase